MKTNLYAMFWLTKAALEHMGPGSAIINTASIQAYDPSPNLFHYSMTKAAIANFTKAMAKQLALAGRGIRINAVAPGPIWTPLQVSGGHPTNLYQGGKFSKPRTRKASATPRTPRCLYTQFRPD